MLEWSSSTSYHVMSHVSFTYIISYVMVLFQYYTTSFRSTWFIILSDFLFMLLYMYIHIYLVKEQQYLISNCEAWNNLHNAFDKQNTISPLKDCMTWTILIKLALQNAFQTFGTMWSAFRIVFLIPLGECESSIWYGWIQHHSLSCFTEPMHERHSYWLIYREKLMWY